MLKVFCLITGDDYNLVKQETPASRKKISVLASVLFIPVMIWFIIGFSIGSSILKLNATQSLLVGGVTGAIIFIIERAIIMSGTNKLLSGMRIFMGLLIALLGSFFIDEVIFKEDIDQQVFLDRNELIESEKSRIHAQYDASIIEVKSRVANAYQQWLTALAEAKEESDGSGGSGVRGLHKIANLKLAISRQHEVNYQVANAKLSALTRELAEKLATTERITSQNITGESILFRVKSLCRLVSSDNWVLVIYSIFTLLLFLLEFVVIMMKHALSETNYERRVSAMEVVGKRRLATITDRDAMHFDPSETSEIVVNAESVLRRTIPSRFLATTQSPRKVL